MEGYRQKEESDKKQIKTLEIHVKQMTEKVDTAAQDLKNVTQNMKNLMKEQVRSILA